MEGEEGAKAPKLYYRFVNVGTMEYSQWQF